MWPPRWETRGRGGLEPSKMTGETQLHPPRSRQTPAAPSSRAAPEILSSTWKWTARPAGKGHSVLDSCLPEPDFCQGP